VELEAGDGQKEGKRRRWRGGPCAKLFERANGSEGSKQKSEKGEHGASMVCEGKLGHTAAARAIARSLKIGPMSPTPPAAT
jgi:hypothetical protein